MDKIKKYQDAVVAFLQFYQSETGGNPPDANIQRRVLIDRENNSFQLLASGWNGIHYIFAPMFHFDIINGKVWMQCNNTEWEAVDFLMEHGVERQDIVLGFVSPEARAFSGFAVA
ncbi:MAG: XisI protein [Saprospiraceae bacterium]|nr:XisI protein [Saprospiraceae bacterium]